MGTKGSKIAQSGHTALNPIETTVQKLLTKFLKNPEGSNQHFGFWGRGCGSVGREITSDARGPGFKSHHHNFYINPHFHTLPVVYLRA